MFCTEKWWREHASSIPCSWEFPIPQILRYRGFRHRVNFSSLTVRIDSEATEDVPISTEWIPQIQEHCHQKVLSSMVGNTSEQCCWILINAVPTFHYYALTWTLLVSFSSHALSQVLMFILYNRNSCIWEHEDVCTCQPKWATYTSRYSNHLPFSTLQSQPKWHSWFKNALIFSTTCAEPMGADNAYRLSRQCSSVQPVISSGQDSNPLIQKPA